MAIRDRYIQPPATPEFEKARTWFDDVRASIANREQTTADTAHLARLDLATASRAERQPPTTSIPPEDERFLDALWRSIWNSHIQAIFAELQDRRTAFETQNGVDIIHEQYATLRSVLDTPELYQQ